MKKYFGLLGLILLCIPAHPVWAGTVTVNTGTTYQTISGFGAASVWVANKITTSLANIFWADDSGQPPASQVNGNVGLSINRILIDESGNSNWGTEAAAAVQALKINPNMRIFGSSWSPPAKWKNNNNTSGNNTGNDNGNPGTNTNQLNASNYQAYANYQTSFVTAMKNTYGFTPYAISVQNEPDYDTTYQSCLWSAAQFDTYIGTYLGPTLQAAGFTNIIMMPESFMDNLNLSATTMGDANAAKYVKVIGAHLYGGGPNTVPASYSTVAGHAVESWETETSEKTNDGNIDSGLFYANQLHSCIVDHNFNAYCYWWLINQNTDDEGLCDNNSNPTKRLYALGNFSKFIRPGFVRIGATEVPSAGVSVSAYYSASAGKVVIVAINNNTSTQSQTFNLSEFTASTAYPWITDSTRNLVQQTSVAVSGGSFTYTLPAQSITSFVAVGTAGPTDTPTITPTPVVFSTWRVNAGGPAYTDTLGNLWAADENFTGGTTVASGGAVTGTSDSTLYDTQRYGTSFSYTFNVPAGSYQVTLKFAETYSSDYTTGARVFNVAVNGTTVVSNLDIYGQVGSNTVDDKVINNVSPSGGTITIQFTGTASTDTSAVLEAIQIIPMPSSTPTFTATSTPSRTATRTSTATLTSTATSSFTRTWTGTPTFSSTSTASATSTPTSSFTSTRTNTATSTSTLTYTSTPTRTLTATVTNTSTWTSTTTRSSTPTVTLTSTGTATPTETSTSTSTSTATSTNTVPSTLTYTSTATPSLTSTRTSTATVTNTPTFSSTSTATPTFTFTGTFSSTPTRSSTPTSTPTWTSTRTSTPTSTNTVSSTLTYTSTATPSLTSTRTSTATVTNTPTVTSTSTATNTGTVPATMTFTVTSTNVLNTLTSTPTRTSTPTSTSTSTATSTHTGVNTGTFTATSTSTPTWSPTVTETSSSTETSTRTASSTPTVTNTGTQLPTSTATVTGTSTSTSTDTSTNTPFFTATPTITTTSSNTITFTFTSTKTSTPTFTATPSWTPTDTVTSTSSSTATATESLTWTATPTSSSTSTATNIFTATSTATWTSSSTFTPTWTATKTATSSNTPTVTSTATYTFSATSTWTATVTTTASSTPTWTSTPTVSDCGKVLISSLYPNPVTSGTVKVDLRSACPKNVKWAVYSAAYRKIGEWNITVTGFERVPLWDLTDAKGKKVAAGVYYIVLTPAGQKSQTLPVVVLR